MTPRGDDTHVRVRPVVVVALLALVAGSCADDTSTAPPATSTTTGSTSTTTTTTSTTTTSTTTEAPAPACAPAAVFEALDAAIVDARLPEGGEWQTEVAGTAFTDTADPDVWVDVLGLDCAIQATQPDAPGDRLALVSWTGPRMAFVIRSSEPASPPHSALSSISVGFENPGGEMVRDDNSLWGGVLETGETLVVGHIDFNLGIAAKTWRSDAPPFGEAETVIEAERVGIAAVRAAGGRNVGVAQSPELGSEEGYVMFVSPAGQILVIDVAPTGWFDPMMPRYYHGETTTEVVDGVEVRVTEPQGDEGEFSTGVEVAWACADHVWILEPGGNGTGDEMVAFVTSLIETDDC